MFRRSLTVWPVPGVPRWCLECWAVPRRCETAPGPSVARLVTNQAFSAASRTSPWAAFPGLGRASGGCRRKRLGRGPGLRRWSRTVHQTGQNQEPHTKDTIATENSGTRGRSIWVHSSQVGKADSQMGVSRRCRVPERITRPDERFDSSQVGWCRTGTQAAAVGRSAKAGAIKRRTSLFWGSWGLAGTRCPAV